MYLDKYRVVLASGSPRRRELLSRLTDRFEVIVAEIDETLSADITPVRGVELLAVRKGAAVAERLSEDALVISSDTLVELDGEPLGKPCDEADAVAMLGRMSGRTHRVHTGVAVHYRGGVYSGVATSSVHFRNISHGEIIEYVATGEPMDKAGAYGIQGLGGRFVESYEGGFDTIMGLSVSLTEQLIHKAVGE